MQDSPELAEMDKHAAAWNVTLFAPACQGASQPPVMGRGIADEYNRLGMSHPARGAWAGDSVKSRVWHDRGIKNAAKRLEWWGESPLHSQNSARLFERFSTADERQLEMRLTSRKDGHRR